MNFFKKLFGKQKKEESMAEEKFSGEQYDIDYEEKKRGLKMFWEQCMIWLGMPSYHFQ